MNFTVKASDVNGDNLIFSASALPAGASFDEAGVFSWTLPTDRKDYTL
ncbi:putative Ig domain-containing protein [Methanosarcina barkeri]|nr:putative Ig domain-containing protein [Methanosarcina barkeri]